MYIISYLDTVYRLRAVPKYNGPDICFIKILIINLAAFELESLSMNPANCALPGIPHLPFEL